MWNPFKKITYQSAIHGRITVGKQENYTAIYSGGVTQSGGEVIPMWNTVIKNEYEMLNQVQHDSKRDILILGVGGGSIIQAIRKHDKKAKITGIELDPIMKQVANEQFGIQETTKQKIIITDAIDFLFNKTKTQKYDLIVVDLYIGPLNPEKSRKKSFILRLKSVLKPHGIILYNAHFQKQNIGEYEALRKITDTVFKNEKEVFSNRLNRVLLLGK